MEQQFQLKEYGKLSLFEQANMTAEERSWWVKRLRKEHEARAEAEKKAGRKGSSGSIGKPSS